jgi:low temperature requirement protein LtrA
MAASWGRFGESRAGAITRISLFGVGWLLEYTATISSVLSASSILIELEYWTERFAALTLVILGEGVFGLFESYRSTFLGPTGGFNPVLIAIVLSSVGLYRVLYCESSLTLIFYQF